MQRMTQNDKLQVTDASRNGTLAGDGAGDYFFNYSYGVTTCVFIVLDFDAIGDKSDMKCHYQLAIKVRVMYFRENTATNISSFLN